MVNASVFKQLAVDGDLGVELVARGHPLEEGPSVGVGLLGAPAQIAARVLDDRADLRAGDAVGGHLPRHAHADRPRRHSVVGERPPRRSPRDWACRCRPHHRLGAGDRSRRRAAPPARELTVELGAAFLTELRVVVVDGRAGGAGERATVAAEAGARSRLIPAAVAGAAGGLAASSLRRMVSSRSMSMRKSSPASISLMRRMARRPVALDHLAVVALGDLAHLVVELDLLDCLEHELFFTLELARAPPAAHRGDRRQRVPAPADRSPASARRPVSASVMPAEREHHQRRTEVHLLDDERVSRRQRPRRPRPRIQIGTRRLRATAACRAPAIRRALLAGLLRGSVWGPDVSQGLGPNQGCGARRRACRRARRQAIGGSLARFPCPDERLVNGRRRSRARRRPPPPECRGRARPAG